MAIVHVHVPKEVIDRYPLLGVLFGLLGIGMFGAMGYVFGREYLAYVRAGEPLVISIADAPLDDAHPRLWVTLTDGEWHPDGAVRLERRGVEALILGKVEDTRVPVTDADGKRLIVLSFGGAKDVDAARGKPVTGVLCRDGDQVWGHQVGPGLKTAAFESVLILSVGTGPKQAGRYVLLAAALLTGAVWLTWYYARAWRRRRRTGIA